MKTPLTLSIAAATLLAGGVAYAQSGPSHAMRGADMSRDQVQQHAGAMFARMDVNGDGRIDSADREARQRARFDKLDADGNGAISFEEFEAVRDMMRERRAEKGAERAEAGERRGRRHMRRGGMRGHMARMVRTADTDNDGVISQAEFEAAALERFDRADANGDGTLTAQERRDARPRRGQRGEG